MKISEEVTQWYKRIVKSEDYKRCDWCGWTLADSVEHGCVRDNCSMRPMPPLREPFRKDRLLADALRDAVAEADENRYWLDRHFLGMKKSRTKYGAQFDEMNSWQFADWQAAAHKKLLGEP